MEKNIEKIQRKNIGQHLYDLGKEGYRKQNMQSTNHRAQTQVHEKKNICELKQITI